MTDTTSGKPLRRSTILFYGLFGVPLAMFGYPLAIWVPPFYAGELGVSLAAVGNMLLFARLLDLVTDPLAGFVSDHLNTRWGRRKPMMAAGLPVLILGIFMLFLPQYIVGDVTGAWYFFLAISVAFLGWTLTSIPYGAWGAELSGVYHERSRVTASRELFVLTGLIVASLVPFFVEQTGHGGPRDVLFWMAMSLFLIVPITLAAVLLFVHEPKDAPKEPIQLGESLNRIWANKVMRHILILIIVIIGAEAFRNALSLFFMRDYIGVDNVGTLYLYYFGMGLVMIPAWLMFGKWIGKHRALAICLGSVSVISIWTWFLNPGDILPFTLLFLAKGACFGGLQFLPLSMLADVVDVDTAESGSARPGSYFAIAGMANKLPLAFGSMMALNTVALVGFDPRGRGFTNTAEALAGLDFGYGIVPGVLFLGALALAWFFPLSQEEQEDLQRKIRDGVPDHAGQEIDP